MAMAALFAALCPRPAASSVAIDEEEVVFRFPAAEARRVYLVGDFNGWNPTIDLMAESDGRLELRLYLVPGSYRYRFIADGVSTADPENPCRDADGNSCFVLIEAGGELEILLRADSPAGRAVERERAAASATIRLDARPDATALLGAARIALAIDGRWSVDCLVGIEALAGNDEPLDGASYLARGSASYGLGGRTLRFFNRSAAALDEEGETLPLFGSSGPYRYPIGLMSRGAGFDGKLVGGLDARVVYASRIEGYRSGLEGTPSPGGDSARREMLDADALGVRIEAKRGPAVCNVLCRFDKRPYSGEWRAPEGGETVFRGYEKIGMWGGRIALRGTGGWLLNGAFLIGGGDRIASVERAGSADTFAASTFDREWERGYRFVADVSRDGARVDARASFARTTIDELTVVGPVHTRDDVSGALSYEAGVFSASLAGAMERYGASGAGSRFWLARENFWLDGDCLTFDRIPFLSSPELREIRFSLAWRREPIQGLPWGTGTAVDLLRRSGSGASAPLAVEVRFSNGTRVHPRAALILDMRSVSYRHGAARGDFIDAFLGLHATIATSHWCLLGLGVSPYAFDRWMYDHAGWGRERYLEDRNVFGVLAAQGERSAVRRLLDAEEALADDWLLTVQAGFTF
jgi:hypothetical protein